MNWWKTVYFPLTDNCVSRKMCIYVLLSLSLNRTSNRTQIYLSNLILLFFELFKNFFKKSTSFIYLFFLIWLFFFLFLYPLLPCSHYWWAISTKAIWGWFNFLPFWLRGMHKPQCTYAMSVIIVAVFSPVPSPITHRLAKDSVSDSQCCHHHMILIKFQATFKLFFFPFYLKTIIRDSNFQIFSYSDLYLTCPHQKAFLILLMLLFHYWNSSSYLHPNQHSSSLFYSSISENNKKALKSICWWCLF